MIEPDPGKSPISKLVKTQGQGGLQWLQRLLVSPALSPGLQGLDLKGHCSVDVTLPLRLHLLFLRRCCYGPI